MTCNQVLWSDETSTEITVRHNEKVLFLHKLPLVIALDSLPGKEEAEGDLGLERK